MVVNYKIKDYRKERWNGFKDFYTKSIVTHEVDPASPALEYFCERLKLSQEQRYWVSFLYGITYSVATTFYIFLKFPDYENVKTSEFQVWWKQNKKNLIFQSDRRKVKNFDLCPKIIESYQTLIGKNQEDAFCVFNGKDPVKNYNEVYKCCSKIYYFGRFSLFNYLDSLNGLTNLNLLPDKLDLKTAESSRNGLCYACEKEEFVTLHHKPSQQEINYPFLQRKLTQIMEETKRENPELNINIWNIETSLCAYKKLFWQTRYFGYYIDRQLEELNDMTEKIKDESFEMLFEFRKKTLNHFFLGEINGWNGIRKQRNKIMVQTGKLIYPNENIPNLISSEKAFWEREWK